MIQVDFSRIRRSGRWKGEKIGTEVGTEVTLPTPVRDRPVTRRSVGFETIKLDRSVLVDRSSNSGLVGHESRATCGSQADWLEDHDFQGHAGPLACDSKIWAVWTIGTNRTPRSTLFANP